MKLLQFRIALAEELFTLIKLLFETAVRLLHLIEIATGFEKLLGRLLVSLLKSWARECIELNVGIKKKLVVVDILFIS